MVITIRYPVLRIKVLVLYLVSLYSRLVYLRDSCDLLVEVSHPFPASMVRQDTAILHRLEASATLLTTLVTGCIATTFQLEDLAAISYVHLAHLFPRRILLVVVFLRLVGQVF